MTVDDKTNMASSNSFSDLGTMGLDICLQLFGVVDVLDDSAPLRRALSDPARSTLDRQTLAKQLFAEKISDQAQNVLIQAISLRWRNGALLSDEIERQAVFAAFREAEEKGSLDDVIEQLVDFSTTVQNHDGLREALRDKGFSVQNRCDLINRLVAGRVDPITEVLLRRAVNMREKSFDLTIGQYLSQAAQLRDHRIARVTVAKPLDQDQVTRLKQVLQNKVGHRIDLQVEIDPDVLGGIMVQLGTERIDATFSSRLADLQRQLTS